MQSLADIISDQDVKIRQGATDGLLAAADAFKQNLEEVTNDWHMKPTWDETPEFQAHLIIVRIQGTPGIPFVYVDQGTGLYGSKGRGYTIYPRDPAGRLKFRVPYSARTAPVARAHVGTGQSGDTWVSKKEVYHPGIKPRHFIKDAIENMTPPLEKYVQDGINQALS